MRVSVAMTLFVAGCGGGVDEPRPDAATPCIDEDGDGHCLGGDCDDSDPGLYEGCVPPCDPGSTAPGCPCSLEEPATPCYHGPAGTDGIGICRAGVRVCRDGLWSTCEGEVVPRGDPAAGQPETACDLEDEDCDGVVDDGVLSPCGDCNSDCNLTCVGVDCPNDFAPGAGTTLRDDGALIAAPSRDPPDDVWISMLDDGTVLRVDGTTWQPVGRYRLGPDAEDALAMGVVVDGWGNAFALETASLGARSAAVMMIREGGCSDRDGDGDVETSTDERALPWGTDDCVENRIEVESCTPGTCSDATSIVLTGDGELAWVTLYEADTAVELDLVAGRPTGRAFTVADPASLLDDGTGTLWVGGTDRWLHAVSLDDPYVDDRDGILAAGGLTHLALGLDGTLYAAAPPALLDPVEDALSTVEDDAPHPATSLVVDAAGDVWTANDAPIVKRWSSELEDVEPFDVGTEIQTLALSRDGDLWAVENTVGIYLLDPNAGADLIATIPCDDCDALPHLGGDPTGMIFERIHGPAWARGEGSAVVTFTCDPSDHTAFVRATVTVPRGAARIDVRTAHDAGNLAEAPWSHLGVFPPDVDAARPDDLEYGSLFELRIQTLLPDTVVERIDLSWACVWSSI